MPKMSLSYKQFPDGTVLQDMGTIPVTAGAIVSLSAFPNFTEASSTFGFLFWDTEVSISPDNPGRRRWRWYRRDHVSFLPQRSQAHTRNTNQLGQPERRVVWAALHHRFNHHRLRFGCDHRPGQDGALRSVP